MGISLPNPFKAGKKILKKVAKPFRKVGKFLPKEARPFMPFLSAAMPFMLPTSGIMSLPFAHNPAIQRGFLSGLANIGGQAMADPEGEDINLLSTLLAGGTGALGAEGMGDRLRGGIERGVPYKDMMTDTVMRDSPGFWQGAENLGREGLATAADYLSGSAEGIASLGSNPEKLFDAGVKGARFPGVTSLAKAAAVPLTQGTGDMTKSLADQQWRAFDEAEAADLAEWEKGSMIDDQRNADLTMKYYRAAGHDEETIKTAMDLNEIGHLYEPPVEEEESAAQGGIIGLRNGGMLNFGGREMDLRTGGFVPIGKKERADDVPARLSKNEFVMTADAVRAAGGGSVNKGAQRMYNIMNKLEARA